MLSILLILVFTASISNVIAIKCFSCESVYEPNCGDYFNVEPHFKLDCDLIEPPRYLDITIEYNQNATACVKHAYKEGDVYKIVRHCYFGKIDEGEFGCSTDPSLTSIENLGCFVCKDENFCNHTTKQYSALYLLFILINIIINCTQLFH